MKKKIVLVLVYMIFSAFGFSQAIYNKNPNYKIHVIKKYETMAEIAQIYNTTPSEIKMLNNIGPSTPYYIGQKIKVPVSKFNYSFRSKQTQSRSYNKKNVVKVHEVKKGETLSYISKLYNINIYDLAKFNGLGYTARLKIGEKLKIPLSIEDKISNKKVNSRSYVSSSGKYMKNIKHRVQHGETLYSIAKRYGKSIQEISKENNITHPYSIYIGDIINIKAVESMPNNKNIVIDGDRYNNIHYSGRNNYNRPQQRREYDIERRDRYSRVKEISHRVKRNEALIDIAKRYEVSTYSIRRANRLSNKQPITVGQVLKIPVPLQKYR